MVRGRGALLGLVVLVSGACGGSDSPSSSASGAPPSSGASATTATTSRPTVVPDVVVRDVGTGSDVNIRALALPERPTLYWFWAPH